MSELTSTGRAMPIDGMHIEYLDEPGAPAPASATAKDHGAIIPTASLLTALSTALDMTEGQLSGHAARTAYAAMCIADRRSMPADQRADLFYAALLMDAGCSSNAAALAAIFGGDDIALKARQSTIERSIAAYAVFTLRSLPASEPVASRVRRLVRIAMRGPGERRAVEQLRCERGAAIARKAGFAEAVGTAIMDVHEHWDGRGMPAGRRRDGIDPLARIIAACRTLDIFVAAAGPLRALDVLRRRRGTWFDPEVIDDLLALCAESDLIDAIGRPDLVDRLRDLEPEHGVRVLNAGGVDRVVSAFADIVDAKSPFTGTHSRRTALLAESIATALGLDLRDVVEIRRAGLLHDIGKLGVPNAILDKPGRLTDDEMALIRRHPEMTEQILLPVPTFGAVARIAASHHERLDGTGYHRGLQARRLGVPERVVAVADVYEALTADRPYRDAMDPELALQTIQEMGGRHLSTDIIATLRDQVLSDEVAARVA